MVDFQNLTADELNRNLMSLEDCLTRFACGFRQPLLKAIDSVSVTSDTEREQLELIREVIDSSQSSSDLVKAARLAKKVAQGKEIADFEALHELGAKNLHPLIAFLVAACSSLFQPNSSSDPMMDAVTNVLQGMQPIENRYLLMQLLLHANRYDEADALLARLQHDSPDSPLVRIAEGVMALESGNYADAFVYLRDAISMTAKGDELRAGDQLLVGRGLVNMIRGHVEEAEEDIQRSLEHYADKGDARANLVVLRSIQHKPDEAATHFDSLRTECPNHPLVRKMCQLDAAFDSFGVPA